MSIAKKLGYSIWATLMIAVLVGSEWSSANINNMRYPSLPF